MTNAQDETGNSSWSEAAEKPAPEWEPVVKVGSVGDLFANHSGKPMLRSLRLGDGAMIFRGAGGGVSRKSAPARAGQVFRAVTTVTTNGEGEPAPVHFGPMFFNARDEILLHSRQVPIKAFGEEQEVDVQSEAPEGTVSVRMRMVGAWAKGRDTSGITCTYGPAVLYRAK